MTGRPQPGELFFQQSIADLSRRLDERPGVRPLGERQADAREALHAYERERTGRIRTILVGVGAAAATACLTWFVVLLAQPDAADPHETFARPVTSPVADPAPEPRRAPMTEALAPLPAPVETAAPIEAAPVEAPRPTVPAPLAPNGIREVQRRLLGFGFNPGPIDGVAGRQTEEAAQHYLEARGRAQMPPNDPQLLDQLRRDQAPAAPSAAPVQAARRLHPPAARDPQQAAAQHRQRAPSFDPFQPVKLVGAGITRALQSVFRQDSASSR